MKLLLCLFLFFNISFIEPNPCDIEVSYRTEDTTDGKANGKIFITFENGTDPVTINLFDENEPSKGFIKSEKYHHYQLSKEILVFKNLKPSSYIVRIDNSKCKTSISGMDGIIIN